MKILKIFPIILLLTCCSEEQNSNKEFDNVFSSAIYDSFFSQLFPGQDVPKEHRREVHEAFVKELRFNLNDEAINHVYEGVNLNQAYQNFLYNYVAPPQGNLGDYLITTQKQIAHNLQFNSQSELPEDGLFNGNLPSIYFTLDKTKVIRMGMPLHEKPGYLVNGLEITPEFNRFIETHPRHLYVNLLKRHGIDWKASKQIEKLPHGYVITLDKNSLFYKQDAKAYPQEMTAVNFKESFLKQMKDKKGAYFWSPNLDRKEWKKELSEIVERVDARYFAKENLNAQERRDFIELTYLEILDALVAKWHPPTMNLSCHQGMDRTPSLLVLWMLKHDAATDSEAAALLLVPPMAFHNRASYATKVERMVSALRRLQS